MLRRRIKNVNSKSYNQTNIFKYTNLKYALKMAFIISILYIHFVLLYNH